MEKLLIKNDTFNIVKRLKKIDKKYFVLYNLATKKYEIHFGKTNTLQLVVPYNSLDKRTLNLVLKTRVENHKKILEEMERHNQKLDQEKQNKMLDEARYKAKEMLQYASQKSDTQDFKQSYINKWI